MNNPTQTNPLSRNLHTRAVRGFGHWRHFFVVALMLGLAAVLQTVRADSVVLDDNFNDGPDYTNNYNIGINTNGIGSGFSAFTWSNGVNAYTLDAFETNNWNSMPGGWAVVANSTIGALSASINSLDAININGGGTTFEFSNVNFSTLTPSPNTGLGNNDELVIGVSTAPVAARWYANTTNSLPNGFWIQTMSDSMATGAGSGAWTGRSTLFYSSSVGATTKLATWTYDNLIWSTNNAVTRNFTPALDIKLTLSATGWALNITGDTAGGNPINFTGTYAGSGIVNQLINGLNVSHVGALNQTENPGIAMQIDRVVVSQLGNLSVTTPTFNTPYELNNTNVVLAGDATILTSVVTGTGTPTLQWQLETAGSPGTFTNLPSGTSTNVSVDTSGLGDNTPRGVRLIGTLGGLSVTSAVVELTVLPPSAPQIVQDIDPNGFINLYTNQPVTFSAVFFGSQPITYQWQFSADGTTFTNIPNATNDTFNIASIADENLGTYQVVANNYIGSKTSGQTFVNVADAIPLFLWSQAIKYGGLNAGQILTNFPSANKIAGAMYANLGGSPLVVSNGIGGSITFAGNSIWTSLSAGAGYSTGANTNQTGDANFNAALDANYYDNATHTIILSNLVVGQQYQVQLFGLDDRAGNGARKVNFQNPVDNTDISVSVPMGANAYVLGSFTANATVQRIQQNMTTSSGNFNCLVLRTVGWNPKPYFVQNPGGKSSFNGLSVTFNGVAAGDSSLGAISYQWESGTVGGPYAPLTEGAKYVGTTNTSLTVNNLTSSDGNVVYVLVASNTAGSQTSAYASLLVQPVPAAPSVGSYGAAVLSNNPVGLWMLNNTNDPSTGVLLAYDSSGNGNFGIFGATCQDGFNGIAGPQAPAYSGFDANQSALGLVAANNNTSTYVTLPAMNDTNLDTTVCLWINPLDNGNYAHGLIGGRNTGVPGQIWQFGYSAGNGTLGYNWNDNGATYNYNSGLTPILNTWNFVCMVIQSNQTTFYLCYISNGALVIKSVVQSVANSTVVTMHAGGLTAIGTDPYAIAGRTFNGTISGAALFNSALSSNKVAQLFITGVGVAGHAPTVVAQPANYVTNYIGNSMQFNTTIGYSDLPLTNQWQLVNGVVTNNLADGSIITGSQSNVLSFSSLATTNSGVYRLLVVNDVGSTVSSNINLTILPPPTPVLVGYWINGTNSNLQEVSGYQAPHTHDGYAFTNTPYYFTNDVPPGRTGTALYLKNSGIAISNSSTLDANYTNTFDGTISGAFTVAFWAKGWPAAWAPFVSKNGDSGTPETGWTVRNYGANNTSPGYTMRVPGGTVTVGGGNNADLAATSLTYGNDGAWHHYAATYSFVKGTRNLYVDGALVAVVTGVGTYNLPSSSHLVLGGVDYSPGNTANAAYFFTGALYDVRIYNQDLSSNAIQSLAMVPDPLISVTPPAFQTNYIAQTATLSATISASTTRPLTNQWQFNGVNLVNGTSFGGAVISGVNSNVLTMANATTNLSGTFTLIVMNAKGQTNCSTMLTITTPPAPPAGDLVGAWLTGSADLVDSSGYSPAGLHDGHPIGSTAYMFTNDVPYGYTGVSFYSYAGTAGITITNSSTDDASYVNTYDSNLYSNMTIMVWAKGAPTGWNGFMSKQGETQGWQLRVENSTPPKPSFNIENGGITAANAVSTNAWHLYTATYSIATGTRTLYVDAVQVATATGGSYVGNAGDHLMINGRQDSHGSSTSYGTGNYTRAEFYGARIYKSVLSAGQIYSFIPPPAAPKPVVTSSVIPAAGGNPASLVLSWTSGVLLESTNVAGPWTTNALTPPATNQMTKQADFFKASN